MYIWGATLYCENVFSIYSDYIYNQCLVFTSAYFYSHHISSINFYISLFIKDYRGTQKHNFLPFWTFVQSNKHNRQQKIMPCGQLYSVWHLLRPIAVITLETSRHTMFMPEPSARNTPHPLDTVDVAMIITSFEIKFPVLSYCASYKSCHPTGIHCKWGFSHLAWSSVDSNLLSTQVLQTVF